MSNEIADAKTEVGAHAKVALPNQTAGPSTDWLDRTLDLDRIQQEGPTLKVVTENMRALLACTAMLAACTYMFQHQPNSLVTQIPAVLIGIWTVLYVFLAAFQFFAIIGFAVLTWLCQIVRPEVIKRNIHNLAATFGILALFGVFGILFLVLTSVSRATGH